MGCQSEHFGHWPGRKWHNTVIKTLKLIVSRDLSIFMKYIFARNIQHNDQFCPYDMPDGWEYLDSNDRWVEDTTITVSCVRN